MKKWMLVFTAVVALAGGTLMAADLGNLSGQSCGGSIGTWHFVNNQTGGAADGHLIAEFTSGQCSVDPVKNTGSTQHFYCVGYGGSLLSASTGSLPGKLVLSDFSCSAPPPKCDPKTDPNQCK
jgi:hypothetical protein